MTDLSTVSTTTADTIRSDLLTFVSETFMVEPEDINVEESMIDEGIIDSFGLVEIVAYLEKQYQIKIGEDDVVRANFGSIEKIVAFVQRSK